MEEKNSIDGYCNTPVSAVDNNHYTGTPHRHEPTANHQGPFTRAGSPAKTVTRPNLPNSTSYPNSFTRTNYNNEPGLNHNTNIRATLPNDYKTDFPARKAWSEGRIAEE